MRPYYEHGGITIYHGDCREVMEYLPVAFCRACGEPLTDEQILAIHLAAKHDVGPFCDSLITDPPYGVGKAGWDGYANFRSLIHWLGAGLPSWLGDEGIAVIFTSTRFLKDVVNAPDLPYRWQFIWSCSNNMIPGALGFAKYTSALVFSKKRSLHTDAQDLRDYPAGTAELKSNGHPTPKPLPLMRYMVRHFSPNGGLVIDPFAGSGTTLVAAKQLERRAIGIEIEERYCEIAAKRLSQEVLNFTVLPEIQTSLAVSADYLPTGDVPAVKP